MNKAEIQEALDKAKRQLATAEKMNAPQAVIDTAKKKIEKLEADLAEAEKEPAKKEVADEKKEKPKKEVKENPVKVKKKKETRGRKKKTKEEKTIKRKEKIINKVEKTVTISGKTYTEKDKDFCDKLLQKWHGRKLAMKKAGKKFKTKSISSKVAGDVADAVLKTFRFVESEQREKIIKNPNIYVSKFERIDSKATQFVTSLKDLLGDEYKSEQVKRELDEIEKAIKTFVTKFKKLKK